MVETVADREFFHITRDVAHNQHAPLMIGSTLEIGNRPNPFFGFYESVRSYSVTTPTEVVQVPAIKFLKSISRGEINCPTLPKIAADVAEHYLLLAREIIMEQVRREIAPDAPSRQTCLWLTDTIEAARVWQVRLGGSYRIARLRVHGVIQRVDAAHLLGDSEPLSKTYDRARLYWEGHHSANPEAETLFAGSAEVVEFQT
ncbi:MAG: DUF2441 domain-containing protein [Alphaproteobacteria bacterium]